MANGRLTYKQLTTPTKEEQLLLDAKVKMIESKQTDQLEDEIIKMFGNHSEQAMKLFGAQTEMEASKKLFKFAMNEKFEKFCNDEKRIKLQSTWVRLLGKSQYYDAAIESLNKKINVSVFTQWKGMILLTEYNNYETVSDESSELLDEACKCYMYDALLLRLKFSIQKIINQTADETTFDNIIKDASMMGNIYRAYGYLNAANILIEIAKEYFKISGPKTFPSNWSWFDKFKDQAACPTYLNLLKVAVRYLYLAKKLQETDRVSNKIINFLSPEDGIFEMYKQNGEEVFPGWNTWDGVFAYHKELLGDDNKGRFKVLAPGTFFTLAERAAEETLNTFGYDAKSNTAAAADGKNTAVSTTKK